MYCTGTDMTKFINKVIWLDLMKLVVQEYQN